MPRCECRKRLRAKTENVYESTGGERRCVLDQPVKGLRTQMIGIKRLAQHLNVSIGTVSRALNNRPDDNDATRKRVLEAARELGYVPNQSARRRRRGQTGDIGFQMQHGDFETIARVAGERRVERGHQRIALTLPHDDVNLGHIFRAVAEATLRAHGLKLDPRLIFRSMPNESGGYAIARDLLAQDPRPTAVILVIESISTGLYRGLSEANYLPGRDIAVIGRDSPQARFLSPTLTGFRQSLRDLGVALGEALLASMPNYAEIYPMGTVRKIWPTELVVGESDAFTVPG